MYKILLIVFLIVFSSCVTSPPKVPQPEIEPKQSSLTPGMIKKHIVLKKSTQTEVMEIFGPPDMITKTGNGEMWGYDKVSREVAQAAVGASSGIGGGGGAGLFGAGSGVLGGVLGGIGGGYGKTSQQSQRSESTTTVFLLLYFNDDGVVIDYKLSTTKF